MFINEQTKIATLLKHYPDALETIVKLSPDFKKLRNPILRKLMAGRTSIAMAAKIGGCKPEDFFKALNVLGFEVDTKEITPLEKAFEKKPLPEYLEKITSQQTISFDVRSILAEGNDPLRDIQQKVKELKTGEVLKIINSFEPVPLIKLLEKQGYQTYVDELNKDTYETYFYKSDNKKTDLEIVASVHNSYDWDDVLKNYDGRLVEIDVRHLEMPGPMMTILETLETMTENTALFVNHKRIPVFLLTELKDRNWDYRIKEVQDGEVYLLIFKRN